MVKGRLFGGILVKPAKGLPHERLSFLLPHSVLYRDYKLSALTLIVYAVKAMGKAIVFSC